jgi:hypothetical protein
MRARCIAEEETDLIRKIISSEACDGLSASRDQRET